MKKTVFVSLCLLFTCFAQATDWATWVMNNDPVASYVKKSLLKPTMPTMQRAAAADEATDSTLFYSDSLSIEYHFKVGGIYYKITDDAAGTVEVAPLKGSITLEELNGRPTYKNIGDVVIPERVTVPDEFEHYAGRSYVVTGLGYGAFAYTAGVTSVVMPNTVTYIDEGAFQLCQSVKTIVLSENLQRIDGRMPFGFCVSLEWIEFPDTLTELPTWTFVLCPELQYVKLPSGITVIPDLFCYACLKLPDIEIPSSVTHIGAAAFAFTSLTEVYLPASLQWLGDVAFYSSNVGDLGLSGYDDFVFPDFIDVYVSALNPPIYGGYYDPETEIDASNAPDASLFNSATYANATLHVPDGYVDVYRVADIWSNFYSIIDGLEPPETEKIMVGITTYTNNVLTGMIGIVFPKGEAQSGIVTYNADEGYKVEKMVYDSYDVTTGMYHFDNMYIGTDVPINQDMLFEIYVEKPVSE